MRPLVFFLGGLGLVIGGGTLLILQQRQAGDALRAELGQRRDRHDERARLQAENQRLRATEIPAKELEALRNDHAALQRLRAEVEATKIRVRNANSPAISASTATAGPKPSGPRITEDLVPVEQWRNAGADTPLAALETVLWAAAGGDVELLARSLSLSGDARAKALQLLANLPVNFRGQFSSPEKMIAFFTAKDVPLGSARLIDSETKSDTAVTLVAQLMGPDKTTKTAVFSLCQEGDEWKVIVPMPIVEKYAASLKGPGP